MEKHILISKKMLNVISVALVVASLVLPLVSAATRADAIVYLLTALCYALVGAWGAYVSVSLYARSRLKARMPEWNKEINKSSFCKLRAVHPAYENALLPILQKDADFEQIEAERLMILRYMTFWVYPATVANGIAIFYFAFFS